MKKISYIEQLEKNECGLACIAMLLKYYDDNFSLNLIKETFNAPLQGLSLKNLQSIADYYGYDGTAYSIAQNTDFYKLKGEVPFIAHWNNGTHFVIIEKITKDKVFVVDPQIGKIILNHEETRNKFNEVIFKIENNVNEKQRKTTNKQNFFKEITEIIYKRKKSLIILFSLTILIQFLSILPPIVYGNIIDHFANKQKDYKIYIYLTIILSISIFLLNLLKENLKIRTERKIDNNLFAKYIDKIINSPMSFYDTRNFGDLINRFDLLDNFKIFIMEHIFNIVINVFTIIIVFYFLVNISFLLSILLLCSAILISLVLLLQTDKTLKLTRKMILSLTDLRDLLSETLYNIRDIKINNSESRFSKILNKNVKAFTLNYQRQQNVSINISALLDSLRLIQTLVIFILGTYFIQVELITLGELITFIFISEMFLNPIFDIVNSYFYIVNFSTIYSKINDLFSQDNVNEKIESYENISSIEFRNVSFKYNYFQENILENVNFIIKRGDSIEIKGASGSGKTTLMKLLSGIYKPTSGQIIINNNFDTKVDIRKNLSVILKENKLFNCTILENITMTDDEKKIDIDFLNEVIIHSGLKNMLCNNLNLYSLVSENGANFSEGQRQRILLARMLYKNADIILLDEATNSINKELERNIVEYINNINKTKIFISHDNISLQSNKIFVVSGKKVVQYRVE